MNKNQIISDLYCSKEFNDCINKMEPEHLRDDLRNEVMLILLQVPDEKVLDIHSRNELKFFVARIILNQIQSNTSPFAKKFRTQFEAMEDVLDKASLICDASNRGDIIEREHRESKEDIATQEIENLYWYERDILKLYGQLGSYRAIETETGIPWESTYSTAKAAIKKIRRKLNLAV